MVKLLSVCNEALTISAATGRNVGGARIPINGKSAKSFVADGEQCVRRLKTLFVARD
jgi:hypothetical protein